MLEQYMLMVSGQLARDIYVVADGSSDAKALIDGQQASWGESAATILDLRGE